MVLCLRFRRIPAVLAVALVLLFAGVSEAAIVFPDSGMWSAIEDDSGDQITDPVGGASPRKRDIVGDSTYSAGFTVYDDAAGNENLLFRMRINNYNGVANRVWQVLLDTEGDDDVDWVLQLDGDIDDEVELVAATTGGSTFDDIVLDTTPEWSGAAGTYSEITVVDDGSDLGNGTDHFVSILIPFDEFETATGISTTDTFRVALTTSNDHDEVNGDRPFDLGGGDDVVDGWSGAFSADDVKIPEPSTYALFALGLVVLGRQVRRRRRRGAVSDAA